MQVPVSNCTIRSVFISQAPSRMESQPSMSSYPFLRPSTSSSVENGVQTVSERKTPLPAPSRMGHCLS